MPSHVVKAVSSGLNRCDGDRCAQLYPGGIATDRASQSWSGPPTAHPQHSAGEEEPLARASSSTTKRPIHQVRQAADDSRGVNHWFSFLAPSRLRLRARAVWWFRRVPTLSRLLPASPLTQGIGLSPASTGHCDDRRWASHPTRLLSASWRTADLVDDQQRDPAEFDQFVLQPVGVMGVGEAGHPPGGGEVGTTAGPTLDEDGNATRSNAGLRPRAAYRRAPSGVEEGRLPACRVGRRYTR